MRTTPSVGGTIFFDPGAKPKSSKVKDMPNSLSTPVVSLGNVVVRLFRLYLHRFRSFVLQCSRMLDLCGV